MHCVIVIGLLLCKMNLINSLGMMCGLLSLKLEPSKWVIIYEPTLLITGSGPVGLKKKLQISVRVKNEHNPLRTRLIRVELMMNRVGSPTRQ